MDWDRILQPDVLVLVLAFSIPIVAIIGNFWYQAAKTRSENELKRSMVEQGMSAEEIERVIAARGPEVCGRKSRHRREPSGKA